MSKIKDHRQSEDVHNTISQIKAKRSKAEYRNVLNNRRRG